MISFRFDDGQYHRAPEMTTLALRDCRYFSTKDSWEGRPRFSTGYVLFCVMDGAVGVEYGGGRRQVRANRLFMLDAGRSYRLWGQGSLSMVQIAFDCTPAHFLNAASLPAEFAASTAVSNHMIRLHHDYLARRSVEMCEFALLEVLMDLLEPSADQGGAERLFRSFCRYCDAHLSDPLDAESVSAALGCHRDHLNRVVRRCCGKTFREYVSGLKLDAAQTLLRNTDLSIPQIAARMGFSTEELFVKFFRYHAGVTPRRFRG